MVMCDPVDFETCDQSRRLVRPQLRRRLVRQQLRHRLVIAGQLSLDWSRGKRPNWSITTSCSGNLTINWNTGRDGSQHRRFMSTIWWRNLRYLMGVFFSYIRSSLFKHIIFLFVLLYIYTHTHTHTHIYIHILQYYNYLCIFV